MSLTHAVQRYCKKPEDDFAAAAFDRLLDVLTLYAGGSKVALPTGMAQVKYRLEMPLEMPFVEWRRVIFAPLAKYDDYSYLLRYGPSSYVDRAASLCRIFVRLYLEDPPTELVDKFFTCYHIFDGTRDEHEWLEGFAPTPTLTLSEEVS